MKRIIACTLALLSVITVLGQSRTDSMKVYFHISQWQFDPSLGDNAVSMDTFIESSSVANEAYNLNRVGISPDLIEPQPQGVSWSELCRSELAVQS